MSENTNNSSDIDFNGGFLAFFRSLFKSNILKDFFASLKADREAASNTTASAGQAGRTAEADKENPATLDRFDQLRMRIMEAFARSSGVSEDRLAQARADGVRLAGAAFNKVAPGLDVNASMNPETGVVTDHSTGQVVGTLSTAVPGGTAFKR